MASATPEVVSSSFVSSWIEFARGGDLFDTDFSRRSEAWAHWALSHLSEHTGRQSRKYFALDLPGLFYDPRGELSSLTPHLEIPEPVFNYPDPLFPKRLAAAGNGMLFEWWLPSEVTACKRAVLGLPRGDVSGFLAAVNENRQGLLSSCEALSSAARDNWEELQLVLSGRTGEFSERLRLGFTTSQVSSFFPHGIAVEVRPDDKLAEKSGSRLARRVGVWKVTGRTDAGADFSLGVLTPRLTYSSLFTDPLYEPSTESSAALLVRGIVVRELLSFAGLLSGDSAVPRTIPSGYMYLRGVPARVGAKLPEASIESAVLFLRAYPSADGAWQALQDWAHGDSDTPRAALTVTWDDFSRAHANLKDSLQRLDHMGREQVNTLLPLAWDQKGQVLRVVAASGKSET